MNLQFGPQGGNERWQLMLKLVQFSGVHIPAFAEMKPFPRNLGNLPAVWLFQRIQDPTKC